MTIQQVVDIWNQEENINKYLVLISEPVLNHIGESVRGCAFYSEDDTIHLGRKYTDIEYLQHVHNTHVYKLVDVTEDIISFEQMNNN